MEPTLGNGLPQPVEIDPLSNTRVPGPYPPWESSIFPSGSHGDPVPIRSSLEAGRRNGSQDSLANWYSDNNGPWIPKGAVPEVASDDRFPPGRYSLATPLHPRYGSPPRIYPKIGNLLDNGSGQYVVPLSDSGYCTGISLDNSSVRSYDGMDYEFDNRSLTFRGQDFCQYGSKKTIPQEAAPWKTSWPNASLYLCDTCKRIVKTKSDLK